MFAPPVGVDGTGEPRLLRVGAVERAVLAPDDGSVAMIVGDELRITDLGNEAMYIRRLDVGARVAALLFGGCGALVWGADGRLGLLGEGLAEETRL